jgi:hypothetical protein
VSFTPGPGTYAEPYIRRQPAYDHRMEERIRIINPFPRGYSRLFDTS